MDILNKILSYNDHWRPDEAEWSSSQLSGTSNYQRYLISIGTESNHVNDNQKSIPALVGSGMHLIMEQALKGYDVLCEYQMCETIAGKVISGTADVVYDNGLEYTVGDLKTKGTYQMKKTLLGQTEDVKLQLSIYALMFSIATDTIMAKKGEIYLVHMGDKGYFSKADCAILSIPEKSVVPKSRTLHIELYNKEEVEAIVKEATNPTSDFDCYDRTKDKYCWRCDYCELDCEFRTN